MKNYLLIILLLISVVAFSQKKETDPIYVDDYILIKDGDTLHINLEEIMLLPKLKFKSSIDARYYLWFRKKVFKAYPYATLAATRLDTLNARLGRIKKKRDRRKYTRRIQKYLEGEFTDQLKKMTRTEGRILIKLIHRQTGRTVFENIKEIRSGWKAFWYNATANIFKLSLKDVYDPAHANEDYLIEMVLQRAFMNQQLNAQKAKLVFDFPKIASKRGGDVDVEAYKTMFAKLRKKKKRKTK